MKVILSLFLISISAFSKECEAPKFSVWSNESGHQCSSRMTLPELSGEDCIPQIFPQLETFKGLISSPNAPWWEVQANYMFPNVNYPGAWKNDKIDAKFYSGTGEVFAAKPNVYIQSIHDMKRMTFGFNKSDVENFLATTPMLSERNRWEGKIIEKDKFEVEGVYYDYLFYDVRLPKSKMQFANGVCSTRSEAIDYMLKDLVEMKYPAIALSDFEDHWRVKIPNYPFFCVYPQYNEVLDEALPVKIDLEQSTFTRVLFVLVPYKEAPDSGLMPAIPFPLESAVSIRPDLKITRENMFKEWGVAFLGE